VRLDEFSNEPTSGESPEHDGRGDRHGDAGLITRYFGAEQCGVHGESGGITRILHDAKFVSESDAANSHQLQ
jgi:hypothetical protein